MKKVFLTAVIIVIYFSCIAFSQDKGFGTGIILGEPTGISLKYWTHDDGAFDGAIAWSFTDGGALHLHADYIIHNFTLIQVSSGRLPFYFGIGARLKLDDRSRFGARVPVGLAYLLRGTPVDFFIEIVPILDLAPKTDFKINAAIGGRYFFN